MSGFQPAIHTVCCDDRWANVCDGWPRARDPHSTKPDAQAAGRERVKEENTEHIVHDADGTIEKHTDFRNVTDSTGEGDQHEGHQ